VAPDPRLRSQRGFTLVEVLVAMFILMVGVLVTLTFVSAASRASAANRQRDAATNLARDITEAADGIPWDRLTDTGVTAELQRVPGLATAAGAGYTIRRGDVSFGVAVRVCIIDDPSDGGGPRAATGTFCANSGPAGTADRNPEDYKKLVATITWRQDSGGTGSVVQSGLVGNPGSASGPAVRSIAPRGYGAPFVITNPLVSDVVFDLTTSSVPATLNWLVDGTVQQPSPVRNGTSGLAWTFTWPIGSVSTGILDGDYILAGEAFNEYGVSGPGRQETVILNRRVPFKPRQVVGGRTNFGTVEIEWTANAERDIVGYEVYREGSATPVCALAAQKLDTSCVDHDPPAGSVLRYWVQAYDTDPVTRLPRAGDRSDMLTVVDANAAPYPPASLTASRTGDTVTLTWQRPSPGDPDPLDGVEFYRVYRDGTALGDRYARWFDDAAKVTWQDTATDGVTHSYWVTAVDKHFAESVATGPVTL
jgi:prepilin-type N-terminal cleavage/methylation domain-containing protein